MAQKLALFGGEKTITKGFSKYESIGKEELAAVSSVIESGNLSQFLGSWDPEYFYGGPKIQQFEKQWKQFFDVEYAVSVNSNTSGLIVALGAIGIEPGDEVIVSPWTMSASATSILVWNAIPVFADIENETFNLDIRSIERNITPQTKAILVPDIFGHPADLGGIMNLAAKHGLSVIEDSAQAPNAFYKGKLAGTIADIGVFSLNCHKHVNTGEGGMCVTNDARLAERMALIRNHGEAVVGDMGVEEINNIIGFNLRMTELNAAVGIEQLKKMGFYTDDRTDVGTRLTAGLKDLVGLITPEVKPDCTHVYYMYGLQIDLEKTGVTRERLLEALAAEGVPALCSGYLNIHLLPIYQRKIAHGSKGFPWSADFYKGNVDYSKGICPVAEELQDETYFAIEMCVHQYTVKETDLIIRAFHKVWDNMDKL
jgi:perosamine synthetase